MAQEERRPYGYWEKVILPEIWRLLEIYERLGFKPTLRQVFYRLVSMGLLRNTRADYNQLSRHTREWRENGIELIYQYERLGRKPDRDSFRLALPPDCFADKVRWKIAVPAYSSLTDYVEASLRSLPNGFFLDPWKTQNKRVIIYLEKDALSSLVRQVALRYRVPLLIARGYASFTSLWQVILEEFSASTRLIVLMLTDYDPSGEDMVRDVKERLRYYARFSEVFPLEDWQEPVIKKIALTKEQVEKYNLLPNPMKISDPRAKKFRAGCGEAAYELDALDPPELLSIIEEAILAEIQNKAAFEEALREEEEEKRKLQEMVKELRKRIVD